MAAGLAKVNSRGFDVNRPLIHAQALAFKQHGYDFVVRYVPRISVAAVDLTPLEASAIHDAGLALMTVQHVEKEGWRPSAAKGHSYGVVAAWQTKACGVALGTTIWLDLEGVALDTDEATVLAYCNEWTTAVAAHGFQAGVYVGWRAGLRANPLYYGTKATRFWAGYNLDADQYPAVRGVCMRQHEAMHADIPPTLDWDPETIDVDVIQPDALGGLPMIDWPGMIAAL